MLDQLAAGWRKLRGGRPEPIGKGLEPVLETPLLRVTAMGDSTAPGVFVCFTGVAQAMGGIGAEEFVGSTRLPGFSALFVSDLTRSWFNAFDPAVLVDAISDRVRDKRIVTLGNSMGGYGAVWAGAHLPVETAIAFAPQYSVHPAIVPEEARWMDYRRNIATWRHKSLDELFRPQTQYITINGSDDELHWRHFRSGGNAEHILLEASGHEPAAKLKDAGILSETIALCVEGKSPYHLFQERGVAAKRIGVA